MPNLKFIIDGDDTPLRKKLADLQKLAAKNGGTIPSAIDTTAITNGIQTETNKRRQNIAAINEETAAIKKKKLESISNQNGNTRITQISDSSAEVAAYNNAQTGIGNSISVIEAYKKELEDLEFEQNRLSASLDAGSISQAQYNALQAENTAAQAVWIENIKRINDALAQNELLQNENTVSTGQSIKATEEQIGILEALQIQLKELKANRITLIDTGQIAATNAEIESVSAEIKALTLAGTTGFDGLNGSITKPVGTLARLQYAANLYKQQAATSFNPDIINKYNKKLQDVESEIARTKNIGKDGFDEIGNAVEKSSGLFGSAWTGLRKIAQILPGIGIAGLISFAAEPILNYISSLNLFSDKLDQTKINLAALNDVMSEADKAAGKQIGDLKALYAAATDTNRSYRERIAAAEQLRDSYASEFANASALAIINGKLKGSYDDLSVSILQAARSEAASTKIGQLQSVILDAEYQKDKIRNGNTNKVASLKKDAVGDNSMFAANNLYGNILESNAKAKAETKVQDELIKTAANQQNFLLTSVSKISKANDGLSQANKLLGNNLQNFDNLISKTQDKKDLDNIQSALQTKLDALAPNDKQRADLENKLRQVEALEKKYQPKLTDGKAQESAADTLINEQISIQQKIKDFTAKNTNKDLNPDDAAIQQIKDQFNSLTAQITVANSKYDAFVKKYGQSGVNAFNANPDNKVKLQKINPASLQPVENNAIINQENLNQNKHIAEDIETKKKMYSDYEAFKLKVGSVTADAEYADLLKGGKDFKTYLTNIKSDIDATDFSGPIDDRYKLINKALDGMTEDQKTSFESLLVQSATFATQRQYIIQSGLDAEKKLRDKGFAAEADQVKKNTDEELTQIEEDNVKKLDAYKTLFDYIDTTSSESAQKQINNLEVVLTKQLSTGQIGAKAYIDIMKSLNNATAAVKSRLPDAFKAVGSELTNISSSVGQFDSGLGKALGTVGSLVSGIGSIQDNLDKINASGATNSDKLTSGLGILGTFFGLINTFVTQPIEQGQADHEAEISYQYAQQVKNTQAINKELERQLSLTDQIYGPEKIDAYLSQLNQIKSSEADIQKQLSTKYSLSGTNTVLDGAIAKLNEGQKIGAEYQSLIDNAEKQGEIFNLAGQSIDQLQKLLDEGKLDDKTAQIAQAYVDLQQQAIDTQNALNEALTGTNFDTLLDNIVSLFQNATTSAEDFGNNFQKIIQDALLNSFKRDYLGKQLQGFYDDLTKLTQQDGTLTKDDIAKLQQEYNSIITNADQQFKAIQSSTGITFGDSTSTDTSLNKNIQEITSDQANALEGIMRGQYDYQKKTYEINLSNSDLLSRVGDLQSTGNNILQKQADIAMQGVNSLMAIQINTANTVIELQKSNASLAAIVTNTKPISKRGSGLVQ